MTQEPNFARTWKYRFLSDRDEIVDEGTFDDNLSAIAHWEDIKAQGYNSIARVEREDMRGEWMPVESSQ